MAKVIILFIISTIAVVITGMTIINGVKQHQTTIYVEFYKMCNVRELTPNQCGFAYNIWSPSNLFGSPKYTLEEAIELSKSTIK